MSVAMRRQMTVGLLGFGLLVGCAAPAGRALADNEAAEATPAAAPANPYAQAAAAQERVTAKNLRKDAETYNAKAATYADELKAQAEAVAAAQIKEAEAREALADAIEANDSEKSNAINRTMPTLAGQTWRAWRKLTALEAADRYSKPLAAQMASDTLEGAKPALEALGAAQRAAAKAFEKYAAAITPDAPMSAIEEAYDDAIAAADAVKLAGMAWEAAKAIAYRKVNWGQLNDPDLDKKLQELEKNYSDQREVQRQLDELKIRMRKLQRAAERINAEALDILQKPKVEAAIQPAPAAPAAE